MDGDFFFVVGIVLVLAAVALSFLGIRDSESFPPSRAILAGVTALFAAVVATTMAFAVVKSNDEQEKRNEELAKEEQAAETAVPSPGGQPQASGGGNTQKPQTGAATTLAVSSPADGSLVFDPDGLQADPGNLTLTYENPSQVPHSIALEAEGGNVLAETQPFTAGEQSLQLTNVGPGEYTFFCTVPGHREAGMEGTLTVGGGGPTS